MNNWTFTITLDAASHIYWGMAVDELTRSELKELKQEFERQVRTGMKKDLARLQQSNHRVHADKEYISVENVTPDTLMEVLKMFLDWTGDLGDHYVDDLYAMVPVDDITTYLEENDTELLEKFNAFIDENYWD